MRRSSQKVMYVMRWLSLIRQLIVFVAQSLFTPISHSAAYDIDHRYTYCILFPEVQEF